MNVRTHILAYIKNEPFILCEPTLAAEVARNGWEKITKEKGIRGEYYSIVNCLGKAAKTVPVGSTIQLTDGIQLEEPVFEYLNDFYEEHGLEPLMASELEFNHVQEKLKKALTLLETVEPVYCSIKHLLRTIQVLRQDDPEIDTSYSHPNIPFSIFVSVCEDASQLSSLRVAESILHETMHLQLTLIEDVIELIQPDIENYYFSPWRDEDRPARGILHGIFVFRAIGDFYRTLLTIENYSEEVIDFLTYRIESINSELESLKYFDQIPDLTDEGKSLVYQLLSLKN